MAAAAASPAVEATATRLLDFSGEYDVPLLDSTVDAFFGSKSNEEVCFHRSLVVAVQSTTSPTPSAVFASQLRTPSGLAVVVGRSPPPPPPSPRPPSHPNPFPPQLPIDHSASVPPTAQISSSPCVIPSLRAHSVQVLLCLLNCLSLNRPPPARGATSSMAHIALRFWSTPLPMHLFSVSFDANLSRRRTLMDLNSCSGHAFPRGWLPRPS